MGTKCSHYDVLKYPVNIGDINGTLLFRNTSVITNCLCYSAKIRDAYYINHILNEDNFFFHWYASVYITMLISFFFSLWGIVGTSYQHWKKRERDTIGNLVENKRVTLSFFIWMHKACNFGEDINFYSLLHVVGGGNFWQAWAGRSWTCI